MEVKGATNGVWREPSEIERSQGRHLLVGILEAKLKLLRGEVEKELEPGNYLTKVGMLSGIPWGSSGNRSVSKQLEL